MKINKRILKQMILETLNESEQVAKSLSGGAGVSASKARINTRKQGDAAVAKADVQTPDENKIIDRFMTLLGQGAEQLDLTDSSNYPLLNTLYKRVLAHLQNQLQDQSPIQGEK